MLHSAALSSPPRRLWRKILIAFAALLVLIFITAEIILATDLPRNLVISIVEKQFGLRLSAKSLSTGIFGHTTLNDVTVTLPLADKAFLQVPVLKIDHTWLPGIIFGVFNVHDIYLQHPHLQVLQDPAGSWNLLEVAELLARTGGGNNAQQAATKPNDIPALPALDIDDATLVVTDNQRRSAVIEHLALTGRPDGPLVWQYHATIPSQLDLTGKLAPGGPWAHEINLQIQNIQSWLAPWISSWPSSAQLQARWTGRIDSGNLAGRFEILHANYNSLSISGPLEFTSGDSAATLRPTGLLVSVGPPDSPSRSLDTRIVDGDIVFNSSGIESQNLRVECARGRASLDAKYVFADGSASLHTIWRDLALPSAVVQSGDLQLDYSAPLGLRRFTATLQNQGTTKSGKWDAGLSFWGSGNDLKTASFSMFAQKLTFEPNTGKPLDFSGLTADVGAYPGGLLLRDLRIGHAHPLDGQGGYSTDSRTAWLSFEGHGLPLALPGEAHNTLDVDLNFWENPQRVHLQQFYLNTGIFSAYANGDYVYNIPKPLKAHAYLSENPTFAPTDSEPQSFRGLLQSTIDLNGTLSPVDLVLTGSARGNDVYLGQRPLGNVNLLLTGYFRDDLIYVSSQNVQLLGGDWNVSGYWPARYGLFRIDNLSVQHLSLPLAADSSSIAGTLDGRWSIDVNEPALDGIVAEGSATIHNLVIGNPQQSSAPQYLTFDEIQIPTARLEYGMVDINPITVTRKSEGSPPSENAPAAAIRSPAAANPPGIATLSLFTTLEHPKQLTIGIDAHNWPIHPTASSPYSPSPGTPGEGRGGGSNSEDSNAGDTCLLSANGKIDLDLGALSALGHLDLQADTSWNSQPLGQLQTSISLDRRAADIESIQIKTLGGSAAGSGFFNLDKPFSSRLALDWKNLNLAALKPVVPSLASISGKSDGSLRIHPATSPRPLGPLAIDLTLHSNNIQFKTTKIGDLQASAFLGPDRIVLNDSPDHPSQIAFADGIVRFWGRLSKHEGDIYESLLQLNLIDLQLDTLLPAGSKVARTPGLLSGQITILGRAKNLGLSLGQGTLTLAKSDLAGTGPIAFLYNLMHLSHNASKPTGNGEIDFTIQNQNAYITAMHYFDRGSEVRLSGTISNLADLPRSPLSLTVVGSLRPLASINIPGFADFDETLGALQHDAITVKVGGYLNNPTQKEILFRAIGQDMRNLLFGDSRAATQ